MTRTPPHSPYSTTKVSCEVLFTSLPPSSFSLLGEKGEKKYFLCCKEKTVRVCCKKVADFFLRKNVADFWLRCEQHHRYNGFKTQQRQEEGRRQNADQEGGDVDMTQSNTGRGTSRGREVSGGEGPRTVETWYVSRHYDPRTEVWRGGTPKVPKL